MERRISSPRTLRAPPLPDLHGVAVAAPDCAFLCGQGGALLRFDGRRLVPIDSRTRRDLLCAACAGPDEAWFGGAGVLVHYRRAYRHEPRREGPREHVTTYPVPCWLRAACCLKGPAARGDGDGGEAWLLGPGRLALRWHGEALTPRRLVDPAERARAAAPGEARGSLLALAASAPDDVWAGGVGGALLHFDGRALRRVESGTRATITALCLGPSAEPWVGTSTGELRRLVDRAVWSLAAVVAGPAVLAPRDQAAPRARAQAPRAAQPTGHVLDLAYPQALCAIEDRIYLCTEAAVLQLPVPARC